MTEPPASRRPPFDMARIERGDKILAGSAAVLFVDCFLTWQRLDCLPRILGVEQCQSANAWQGSATVAGVLMGFLAFLLAVAVVGDVANAALPLPIRLGTLVQLLAWTALLFGLIKFLVVLAHHAQVGAWIGLAALIAIAYGAWTKAREARAGPGTGFPDPSSDWPA